MEYRVPTTGQPLDLSQLERLLLDIDPAAVSDVNALTGELAIAAAIALPEMVALLNQAGGHFTHKQVRQLPSTCCGDCSG
ncbi:MAG TPA: hypothetical protein VFN09_15970 [Rhodanobacteraceae bacterium]|nr:hypothetical protein [Rhodanobacteraceae bacterium]